MNYYAARQRESDQRWDYTLENNGRIRPVGYCAPWKEWNQVDQALSPEAWQRYLINRLKYHDQGHATAEKAQACYKRYLLDNSLTLMHKLATAQHQCAECGEWTSFYADINGQTIFLCELHNNREGVEAHFEVGESLSSF